MKRTKTRFLPNFDEKRKYSIKRKQQKPLLLKIIYRLHKVNFYINIHVNVLLIYQVQLLIFGFGKYLVKISQIRRGDL